MTLVLTELSPFGIAMAADTAVTTSISATGVAFAQPNAATKLQVIDPLQAGVACWGLGEIAGQASDGWLSGFIDGNADAPDLDDFANRLAWQLNDQVGENPEGTNRLGFHIAGFVDHNGRRLPSFYHVHDGPSTALEARGEHVNPHRFNANHDMPPAAFSAAAEQGRGWITRNGDYQLYAAMFQKLEEFFLSLRALGIVIPDSQDVGDRASYLVFQIRTIASLYRLSNLLPGIGGGITYLAITTEGIHSLGIRYF
ncbi:MAG: hypothetical protein E3J81_10150 [Dehalococcoidia bacterium]|nr:MAG: hypothetical protein E3J81_10150 [Dehalococcoidia bacterium]